MVMFYDGLILIHEVKGASISLVDMGVYLVFSYLVSLHNENIKEYRINMEGESDCKEN